MGPSVLLGDVVGDNNCTDVHGRSLAMLCWSILCNANHYVYPWHWQCNFFCLVWASFFSWLLIVTAVGQNRSTDRIRVIRYYQLQFTIKIILAEFWGTAFRSDVNQSSKLSSQLNVSLTKRGSMIGMNSLTSGSFSISKWGNNKSVDFVLCLVQRICASYQQNWFNLLVGASPG